jgi:hypothetical protein
MKKIVLTTIIVTLIFSAVAQKKEGLFKYEKGKFGVLHLKPKEYADSFKGQKHGTLIPNEKYFINILCPIQKESFTKKELENLKKSTVSFKYYFDYEGNFVYGYFLLINKAKSISEESLFKFYKLMQKVKLDTAQWGEIYTKCPSDEKRFDYSTLTIPLGRNYSFCEQKK